MATRREREAREERETSARAWADKQDRAFEATSVKLPEGYQFWSCKQDGVYRLDFFKYKVGKHNPCADEGMKHFERTYWVHRIPVAGGKTAPYCCLAQCFGQKCPVCEWMLVNNANKEMCDSLRPQQRHLWNVLDVTNEQTKKLGIQVWDNTFGGKKHPGFAYLLKAKLQTMERYGSFANLKGGYTLYVKMEQDSFSGNKFYRVANIDMEPRKADYDASILADCVCLDDCLLNPGYAKLKSVFLMEPADGDSGDDDADTATVTPAGDDEGEGEKEGDGEVATGLAVGDKVEYEGEICTIAKFSDDGSLLRLKADDGTIYMNVDPAEVTPVAGGDEDEEEVEETEDEDEGDDDEAEDDEEELEDEEDEEDEDDATPPPPTKPKKPAGPGKPAAPGKPAPKKPGKK